MYILDKAISNREPNEIPVKYVMYLQKFKLVATEIRNSAGHENKCLNGFPEMVYERLAQ